MKLSDLIERVVLGVGSFGASAYCGVSVGLGHGGEAFRGGVLALLLVALGKLEKIREELRDRPGGVG